MGVRQTIDGLDPSALTYYGKVGAVWFSTDQIDHTIQVTAKTINGNYGKTFPGLSVIAANTATVGRHMDIPLLVNTPTYRTFTGFFNTSFTATYTVNFYITDPTFGSAGSFSKTFVPNEYMAFNPFVEAGISAGSYENYYLLVWPDTGGTSDNGIMCFGAIANNHSNDPSALIAYPFN